MANIQGNVCFLNVLDNSIASLDLPPRRKPHSEIENRQKLHEFFNSTQNRIEQSASEKESMDLIEKRLRYMATNPSRLKVNQNQLEMFIDLPSDVCTIDLLSAYYACFYLSPAHSKSVLAKRTSFLNQLLCAAYHDIIEEMINSKLPYCENLARHLVLLEESDQEKKTSQIKQIVDNVATKYDLKMKDILFYFHNRVKNQLSFENWPEVLLNEYIQVIHNPNDANLDGFLREKNLRDLFDDDEIKKYNLLFKSYVTKLRKGQLGKFVPDQKPVEVNPFPEPKPWFPVDIFDQCHIIVIWLDSHIGQHDNCRALKSEFRQLTNCFRVESTAEGVRSLLPNIKDRKLFCIIQGSLAEDIVPDIERIIPEQLEPVVYLFCHKMAKYTDFGLDHDCIGVRGQIFDHEKDLLGKLTIDLNEYASKLISDAQQQMLFAFTSKLVSTIQQGYQMFNQPTVSKDTLVAVS